MHTSLILYAEPRIQRQHLHLPRHRGTGSDMHSAITGGIGALRGPKHGGANEVAFEIQKRYDSPMKPKPISSSVSPTRKSSSASATRSTPSPIRATR